MGWNGKTILVMVREAFFSPNFSDKILNGKKKTTEMNVLDIIIILYVLSASKISYKLLQKIDPQVTEYHSGLPFPTCVYIYLHIRRNMNAIDYRENDALVQLLLLCLLHLSLNLLLKKREPLKFLIQRHMLSFCILLSVYSGLAEETHFRLEVLL